MRADRRITHQELCFGCGQANLFGLQLELEPREDGGVQGRFFVKQDHQGPPDYAHGGIMATALDEAMSLLAHHVGEYPLTARLEVDLRAPAPVGAFVLLEAELESNDGRRLHLRATATDESGEPLATATGLFIERK